MMAPDPSITISCDSELIVFSDDANSLRTEAEVITIPLTAVTSGSGLQGSSQPDEALP
jgi:hypothetical protein